MITFKNDWLNYPSAVPDYKTTNQSFIDIANDYKSMGVKNYLWPLALLNPILSTIDPRDPDLPPEYKAMIKTEVRLNPVYFIREIIRIPPKASAGDGKQFRANRGNMALFWCFWAGVDILLIQPRQSGKSVGADAIMVGCLTQWSRNTDHTLLTKDDPLRRANVARIKQMIAKIPSYLNPLNPKNDSDNQHEVTCRKYNNRYITGVARSSEVGADNLGRGLTTPTVQIDESPFFSHIETTMKAALPGSIAARREAIESGNPYGTFLTTTAGKLNSRDGGYIHGVLVGGCPWSENLMDAMDKGHIEHIVDKYSTGKKSIMSAVFSHRQLGETDEWLFKTAKQIGTSGEAADRDLLNIWSSGDEMSPLDETARARIVKVQRDPSSIETFNGEYIFNWYVDGNNHPRYRRNKMYILSLDMSEAIGRDKLSLLMIDPETGEVVGSMACNETMLNRYNQFLLDFMIEFKNTVLIVERKSTAQTLIDTLLTRLPEFGEDPFKRIFNRIVHGASGPTEKLFKEINRPLRQRSPDIYDRTKAYFGFLTTGQTRHELYVEVFKRAANISASGVYDKNLAQELLALVVRNGRIDHNTTGHDDRVISWLMAHWLLLNSYNLDYYGIDSRKVLSVRLETVQNRTPAEQWKIKEKERLNAAFETLSDLLKDTKDPLQAEIIKAKIKNLARLVKDDHELLESIDAVLKTSRERSGGAGNRNNIAISFKR